MLLVLKSFFMPTACKKNVGGGHMKIYLEPPTPGNRCAALNLVMDVALGLSTVCERSCSSLIDGEVNMSYKSRWQSVQYTTRIRYNLARQCSRQAFDMKRPGSNIRLGHYDWLEFDLHYIPTNDARGRRYQVEGAFQRQFEVPVIDGDKHSALRRVPRNARSHCASKLWAN